MAWWGLLPFCPVRGEGRPRGRMWLGAGAASRDAFTHGAALGGVADRLLLGGRHWKADTSHLPRSEAAITLLAWTVKVNVTVALPLWRHDDAVLRI